MATKKGSGVTRAFAVCNQLCVLIRELDQLLRETYRGRCQ